MVILFILYLNIYHNRCELWLVLGHRQGRIDEPQFVNKDFQGFREISEFLPDTLYVFAVNLSIISIS